MKKILFSFFTFFILLSCDKNRVFEKNRDFEDFKWQYEQVATFQTEINDSLPKNVFINLRHQYFFKYRNMIVNLVIISPTGKTETQSINMLLSEPNGRWFSDCSGDICLIKYPLTTFSNYSFKEKGVYTFKIIQDMRENPIEHIMSVGLRIEKANEVLN